MYAACCVYIMYIICTCACYVCELMHTFSPHALSTCLVSPSTMLFNSEKLPVTVYNYASTVVCTGTCKVIIVSI